MAQARPFQLISAARCAYRSMLTPVQQHAYDMMTKAMAQRRTSVTITGNIRDDMGEVYEAVLYDQPFLFDLVRTSVRIRRSFAATTVTWAYRLSDEEAEISRVRVNEELRRLLRLLPRGGGVLETETAIHDLMQSMNVRRPGEGEKQWWMHTILGPLLYREAVCEGAALLFQLLCLLRGVPCRMVVGRGSRIENGMHAWSMVRIGSRYVHVDAFWDMCLADGGGAPRYDYFNLQDSRMCLDHAWDAARYPSCTSEDYSWFARNGAEVDTPGELRALMIRRKEAGETGVNVRLRRPVGYDVIAGIMHEACHDVFRRRMQWDFNTTQQVIHLEPAD